MEDENVEIKKEEQVCGGFENMEDREWENLNITKTTMDILLKQHNSSELIALYMFYVYTAKWQRTWQVKSTTNYVAKGLHWGEQKVIRYKKILISLGLIEDYVTKKSGKVSGHYIRLKVPCNVFTTPCESQGVVESQTNAYTTNNRNAYKNIINSDTLSEVAEDNNFLPIDSNKLPMPTGFTTPATRLYKLYDELFRSKYGEVAQVGVFKKKAILKKLAEQIGEYQVAICLMIFMNWKGTTGQDSFIEKLLANSCHDVVYLPKQTTPILSYVKNVLKFSDNDIIKEVNKKLKQYGIYKSSDTTIQNW